MAESNASQSELQTPDDWQVPVDADYRDYSTDDHGLEQAIITTKMLGRTWRAEILKIVPAQDVFDCPICGKPVYRLQLGALNYLCGVTDRYTYLRVVNLLGEHLHTADAAPGEESL